MQQGKRRHFHAYTVIRGTTPLQIAVDVHVPREVFLSVDDKQAVAQCAADAAAALVIELRRRRAKELDEAE